MIGFDFIIAGKEEGFKWADAKLICTSDETRDYDVSQLRKEGYTQFIFAAQIGYEYTVFDGKIVKNSVG